MSFDTAGDGLAPGSAGDPLFARETVFIKGVADIDGLPGDGVPEVAFAGRSNVGKSSLLNALTGRKALARISNTPGRTRELNFFLVGGALHLVDMPGYGYARAPGAQVRGWQRLIHDYLRGRPELKRVFLLIDARHGIKDADEPVMKAMDEAAVSYQIVLTKTDKIARGALERTLEKVTARIARHPAAHPRVLPTSSQKRLGMGELRDEIVAVCLGDQVSP